MKPQLTDNQPPPVNSMQRCPSIAKDGKYQTFGETLTKLVDVIGMYNECRSRHEALINYEEKR